MTDDDCTVLINGDVVACEESDCEINLSVLQPAAIISYFVKSCVKIYYHVTLCDRQLHSAGEW